MANVTIDKEDLEHLKSVQEVLTEKNEQLESIVRNLRQSYAGMCLIYGIDPESNNNYLEALKV